ncbi:MAG TPA: hypothetical protein VE978_17480 [Chitinophagales bacterium]|nr:hypothetical protein [Chitinophagales bacterium]
MNPFYQSTFVPWLMCMTRKPAATTTCPDVSGCLVFAQPVPPVPRFIGGIFFAKNTKPELIVRPKDS